MSHTNAHDDDVLQADRPPSRRFKVLFGTAMVVIAIGYTWVWQVKTERTVAEPPPMLALGAVTSYISADSASGDRVAALLAQSIGSIPKLRVLDRTVADSADQLLFADLEAGAPGHRLTLRRMDAAADTLLQAYSVNGATVHEAVYRMAVQVSMDLGLPRPPLPSDSSATARR